MKRKNEVLKKTKGNETKRMQSNERRPTNTACHELGSVSFLSTCGHVDLKAPTMEFGHGDGPSLSHFDSLCIITTTIIIGCHAHVFYLF